MGGYSLLGFLFFFIFLCPCLFLSSFLKPIGGEGVMRSCPHFARLVPAGRRFVYI